ncbi:hypothetical protein BDY21DRAFT_138961 [Lineolata rhizophorae]|uniref:Secreted protein n=1 Tax=Lineolata rhizophorae TaxID=578093 RepID=A0A6A6PBI6_9PEZI|nr:hypothetical protein BDY21DRAFT_138961 [Lineolata rhizophorae]
MRRGPFPWAGAVACCWLWASETARTASATASSSAEGSKTRLSATATTRRVTGGRAEGEEEALVGYSGVAAAQSSLNKGSSPGSEVSAGRHVERRARCVVRERRGKGYDRGGERRRICWTKGAMLAEICFLECN